MKKKSTINKITIITPTKNSERTILSNIKSVQNQTYKNFEHLIIDSISTDKTLKIIKKFSFKNLKIISEKDDGIYHAINKGINKSSGNIIAILHSDDFFYKKTILKKIKDTFEKYRVDAVYGDLIYVGKMNKKKIIRYWKSNEYKEGLFSKGWAPPHPSFFLKRSIYKKYGTYLTKHENSSDFELMYRLLEKKKIN